MLESPAGSDNATDENMFQPNVTSKQKNSGKICCNQSQIIQRNKKLLSENAKLKTRLERYKKHYYRFIKSSYVKKGLEDTPRTKVRTLMKNKDKEIVKRRQLFGAVLEQQLKSNYKIISSTHRKNLVTVSGDKFVLKKYSFKGFPKSIH